MWCFSHLCCSLSWSHSSSCMSIFCIILLYRDDLHCQPACCSGVYSYTGLLGVCKVIRLNHIVFATHTLGFNHGRVSESLRNLGVEVIPTLRFLRIMRGLLLVLKHFQWIAGYRFVLWTGG